MTAQTCESEEGIIMLRKIDLSAQYEQHSVVALYFCLYVSQAKKNVYACMAIPRKRAPSADPYGCTYIRDANPLKLGEYSDRVFVLHVPKYLR